MLDYHYVEHHIEIVIHDKDYSLGTWQGHDEERPIEKRVESRKKKQLFYLNLETR